MLDSVKCKNCLSIIGSCKDGALDLNLYSIRFQNSTESYYKPWIYYFGKVLLDSAIAYSTYKSKIISLDKTLLLWVIHWDVWINVVSDNDDADIPLYPGNNTPFMLALKVLYKEVDSNSKDALDKSIETRAIDHDHYTELIQSLNKSFIGEMKLSNGFQIGYLRL
jgi:hypothetical protein